MLQASIRVVGLFVVGLLGASACVEDMGEACAERGQTQTTELECCEGLSSDFTGTCVPCVPQGESIWLDGPGCCEGLQPDGSSGVCEPPSAGTEGETETQGGTDTDDAEGTATDAGTETEGETDGGGTGGSTGG